MSVNSKTPEEDKLLEDMTPGESFVKYLVVRRKDLKEWEGKIRLEMELGDISRKLPAVLWDDVENLYRELSKGDVVKVKGVITTFRGSPQIRIEKIRKAKPDEYAPQSFIRETPCDRRELFQVIRGTIEEITDNYLKELLNRFFKDHDFLKKFGNAPGGKAWHHVYLGGLLEHTVGVLTICRAATEEYDDINRDLLFTGAILHDIGKIEEYCTTTEIEFSDEGRLIGHIIQGDRMIRDRASGIESIPEKHLMLLSHLILSHHGVKEFGSPVEPMTAEAFILYYADEMDSKHNAFRRIKEKKVNESRTWSEYVNLMNRFFYLDNRIESSEGGSV